jgi:hypothetical protein
MNKYQRFKKSLSSWFVEMHDFWHTDKSTFGMELLLVFLFFALACISSFAVGLLVFGIVSAFIAKPVIILIVLGAAVFLAAIPISIIFIGKHIKANQE